MAEIKTVTTLDIQMIDENREGTTTVKLDNPRQNVTREQVSAAMQTPFNNGWFLCSNGKTAQYLGEVIINQSIKTVLDGEDFYVTPNEYTTDNGQIETTVAVSGATIQGYNVTDINDNYLGENSVMVSIATNGLSASVSASTSGSGAPMEKTLLFNLKLVIQGTVIAVPFYIQA